MGDAIEIFSKIPQTAMRLENNGHRLLTVSCHFLLCCKIKGFGKMRYGDLINDKSDTMVGYAEVGSGTVVNVTGKCYGQSRARAAAQRKTKLNLAITVSRARVSRS